MRRPQKIELNVLRGLNELFSPYHVGRKLKKEAEELFFSLAESCPTEQLQNIDPIFKKLATLITIGDSEQLTIDEESELVNSLENIRENLGGPDNRVENLPGQLDKMTEHLKETNCKAKVIFILTQIEYQLLTSSQKEASLEKIDSIINPIKKAFKKINISEFEAQKIARELELIKELIETSPSEIDTVFQNLSELQKKLEKQK